MKKVQGVEVQISESGDVAEPKEEVQGTEPVKEVTET